MADTYRVIAKVMSIQGTCEAGLNLGDEFIIGDTTPQNMCSWAFHTLFPFYSVLKYGGNFPWEKDPDKTVVACPDPGNIVHFELRRERVA